MYITQLEIDNFKSFGKKAKIPFFEGFTVISGPNGSGKSNIIDSILFCLALSSARGLRAEKLTDLINLNSGKNSAEVAITFSDGTRIRRRIKRTPHGYYSYNYLNDRLCKQGDVLDFLSRVGIKPEGYNVVMQGDITRIMEMSDTERRKIIDEIAGVAEFDKKKEQALTELEVVRERIDREEILLHELTMRLGELETEREEALRYRKLQEEYAALESCRSAAMLRERRRELSALGDLLSSQQASLEELFGRKQKKSDEISLQKEKIADLDAEINEKSGTEYLQMVSRLEEARGEIRVAEQTIGSLKEEKKANLEAVQRIYMDRKRAETRVKENTESIRTLSVDRSNIAMELATRKAELASLQQKLDSESAGVADARDQLFARMKVQEEQKAARSELLHRRDMQIEKSRIRSSEKDRLENRILQIDRERSEKERQCSEYAAQESRLEDEKKKLEADIARVEADLLSRRAALEKIGKEIKAHERDLVRLEAQQQAGGGAGSRALETILGMDGVYGTIAQLGKVLPEYATALDIAAGSRLNYVVVETDAVAAGAIAYLKEQRLGRATFLPLSKITAPNLPPLKDSRVIDYAVNLLEFDPLYDTAFRLVFGGTVVVDTLEAARKMIGSYRMVTLEGDLVEKAGAMTGGSRPKKTIGFGVAAGEEIAALRSQIMALENDARDLEVAVTRLAGEADELRRARMGSDEQIARFRMLKQDAIRQCESLHAEKEALSTSLEELQRDVGAGGSELAEIEQEIEEVTGVISAIQEEIADLKARLEDTEIPALTEQADAFRREIEEGERRLRNKDADIADLQRERQHFTRRVEELDLDRGRVEEKNQAIDEKIGLAEKRIVENTEIVRDLESRQKSFSTELNHLRAKRHDLTEALLALERGMLELEGEGERINLQLVSLRERADALGEEITALECEAGDTTTDLALQEIEARMAAADRSIKKIGDVNMLAIEEYDRVSSRIEARTEKKEVLSRERTLILERIEKYEKLKYESFSKSYDAIDENFRKIFARLTSGSGQLVLENEEDPFAGGLTFAVQPRGKKVHLLSSLSGGEKSLTTLAFIFAIQQYMPAPFYALDEIDMFLDSSNVERIAALIQEYSQGAQSIIVSLRKPTIERADRILGVTITPEKNSFVTGVQGNG